ncbi:MAG: hypothetical protein ACI82Z_002017 [Cellvibrionaceae bacterium]|jgi:hypothetical protein
MKHGELAQNAWFKLFLTLSVYISCPIVTMLLVYGSVELFKGNGIPLRKYIVMCVATTVWVVISYYSEEIYWQSLIKLVNYSLALFSMCVCILGVGLSVKYFLGFSSNISLLVSLGLSLGGAVCMFIFVVLNKSKWLNH